MDIIDKIKYHYDNKIYCKVHRQVAKKEFRISRGYIIDYSENFVLLQETSDFAICGYLIFSIKSISSIVLNANDKYYHKIMQLEGLTDQIKNKHKPDLTSWGSIFKSIKKLEFNIIVENEDPDDYSFDIGPIEKITQESVYIRYFNAKGYLDAEPTKINYELISIVNFDDRYINVFSKYLRQRKQK